MEKTIAILAAGIGHRYGGLKQMEPIGPNGEFIIDYSVYDAIEAGFERVIFIIQRNIENEFKATIGRRIAKSIKTAYSFQELDDLPSGITMTPKRTKPWGTVQAVLTCADLVNSPFAVINADDFYGTESFKKLSEFLGRTLPDSNNHGMVGFQLKNTLSKHGSVTRGVCKTAEDGTLDSIEETTGIAREGNQLFSTDSKRNKTVLDEESLVSMNMWGFAPSIFPLFAKKFRLFLQSCANDLEQELVLPTAMNSLIAESKVSLEVLSTLSSWFGITYAADKKEVGERICQLIRCSKYPGELWK